MPAALWRWTARPFPAGDPAACWTTPNIRVEHRRVDAVPEEGAVVIATGPLTEGPLAQDMIRWLGEEQALSFL